MIRIVLVGLSDDNWRVYRQTRWMGEVRQTPELASRPRLHFDIDEVSFQDILGDWEAAGASANRDAAMARLRETGAEEVRRS